MAKLKNKFIFSFFIVGGFIVYSISTNFQKISRLFGEDDAKPSTANLLSSPSSPSLNNSPAVANNLSPNPMSTTGKGSTGMMAPAKYKDGAYTGDSIDVYYGYVRVKAIISNGQLTDVQFLEYPSDRQTSLLIASESLPILRSEAISAQSAQIDMVSGATETSRGFIQSLSSALQQA